MEIIKKIFIPITFIAALIIGNNQAMEVPKIRYQGPSLEYKQQFIIKAMIDVEENKIEIGRITYEYLGNQVAIIDLFEVNKEFRKKSRKDKSIRIGQHLFQKCVDEVIAHGCTSLEWTVNPTDDLDTAIICIIYEKIVKHLKNSESYTFSKSEKYGRCNEKVDMALSFNKA